MKRINFHIRKNFDLVFLYKYQYMDIHVSLVAYNFYAIKNSEMLLNPIS